MNVHYANEIDVSALEFSEVKPFGDHAKIVYINYKNKPLFVQTPLMKCPYGLGKFDDGERTKYSLDLSFGNTGESKSINNLKTFVENVDDMVLEMSTKNSLEWFKKKNQSKDVSQALYTSALKVATENGEPTDKYPPTFKLKVPSYNDEFKKVQCYNENKETISPDLNSLLGKGQTTKAIVKLVGIWLAGGKFGVTWELTQLKLTPNSKGFDSYAFHDDDDDNDDDVVANETESSHDVAPPVDSTENYVIDSDDEL